MHVTELTETVASAAALVASVGPRTGLGSLFVQSDRPLELGRRVRVVFETEGKDALLAVEGPVAWVIPPAAVPPGRQAGFGLVVQRVSQEGQESWKAMSQGATATYAARPGMRLLPFRLGPKRGAEPPRPRRGRSGKHAAAPAPVSGPTPPAPTAARGPATPPPPPQEDVRPLPAAIEGTPAPGVPRLTGWMYTVYPDDKRIPKNRVQPMHWPLYDTPTVEIAVGAVSGLGASDPAAQAPAAAKPAQAAITRATSAGGVRELPEIDDSVDDEVTEVDPSPEEAADGFMSDETATALRHPGLSWGDSHDDDDDPSVTLPGEGFGDDTWVEHGPSSDSLIPTDEGPRNERRAAAAAEALPLPSSLWLGLYRREPMTLFPKDTVLPVEVRYQLLLPDEGDIELRFYEGEADERLRHAGTARLPRAVFEADPQIRFRLEPDGILRVEHDDVSAPQRFPLSFAQGASLMDRFKKLWARL